YSIKLLHAISLRGSSDLLRGVTSLRRRSLPSVYTSKQVRMDCGNSWSHRQKGCYDVWRSDHAMWPLFSYSVSAWRWRSQRVISSGGHGDCKPTALPQKMRVC